MSVGVSLDETTLNEGDIARCESARDAPDLDSRTLIRGWVGVDGDDGALISCRADHDDVTNAVLLAHHHWDGLEAWRHAVIEYSHFYSPR